MQMINIGSSQLYETKQSLLILRLAELQAAVIAHFVHNGQAGQFVTLAAQLAAARLEAYEIIRTALGSDPHDLLYRGIL